MLKLRKVWRSTREVGAGVDGKGEVHCKDLGSDPPSGSDFPGEPFGAQTVPGTLDIGVSVLKGLGRKRNREGQTGTFLCGLENFSKPVSIT